MTTGFSPPISELGPDALLELITEDELFKALRKKKNGIQTLLLDQVSVHILMNYYYYSCL